MRLEQGPWGASLPGDPAAGPPFSRTGMRCTTERYGQDAAGAPLGPLGPRRPGNPDNSPKFCFAPC